MEAPNLLTRNKRTAVELISIVLEIRKKYAVWKSYTIKMTDSAMMRTWRKKNVSRRSCCSRFIASTPVTLARRTVRKRAADEMRTSFSFCCHMLSIMWVNAFSCRIDITTQWLMMAIREKKVMMMMSKMLPNLSLENWIVDLVELWCFILVDNRVPKRKS